MSTVEPPTPTDLLIELGREGLYLAVLLAAPAVVAAFAVGLIVSVAQAVTQVHEPTAGFLAKTIAVLAVLSAFAPWIGAQLHRFATVAWQLLPALAAS